MKQAPPPFDTVTNIAMRFWPLLMIASYDDDDDDGIVVTCIMFILHTHTYIRSYAIFLMSVLMFFSVTTIGIHYHLDSNFIYFFGKYLSRPLSIRLYADIFKVSLLNIDS